MATNFEPHESVIFVQSTKIGTNENKGIHSISYIHWLGIPQYLLLGFNFKIEEIVMFGETSDIFLTRCFKEYTTFFYIKDHLFKHYGFVVTNHLSP